MKYVTFYLRAIDGVTSPQKYEYVHTGVFVDSVVFFCKTFVWKKCSSKKERKSVCKVKEKYVWGGGIC